MSYIHKLQINFAFTYYVQNILNIFQLADCWIRINTASGGGKNYTISPILKCAYDNIVFSELCKAFDKTNDYLLCKQLRHYGRRDVCSSWVRSYLPERERERERERQRERRGRNNLWIVEALLFVIIYTNVFQDLFNIKQL